MVIYQLGIKLQCQWHEFVTCIMEHKALFCLHTALPAIGNGRHCSPAGQHMCKLRTVSLLPILIPTL